MANCRRQHENKYYSEKLEYTSYTACKKKYTLLKKIKKRKASDKVNL